MKVIIVIVVLIIVGMVLDWIMSKVLSTKEVDVDQIKHSNSSRKQLQIKHDHDEVL